MPLLAESRVSAHFFPYYVKILRQIYNYVVSRCPLKIREIDLRLSIKKRDVLVARYVKGAIAKPDLFALKPISEIV
jgi:hypothetical protein